MTNLIKEVVMGLTISIYKTFYIYIFEDRNNSYPTNNNLMSEPQSEIDQAIIEEKITKTNGEIIIKKYLRGKALGRGGFAKCYEITNLETKKISAAKIIAKSTLNRSRAKQKVRLFQLSS